MKTSQSLIAVMVCLLFWYGNCHAIQAKSEASPLDDIFRNVKGTEWKVEERPHFSENPLRIEARFQSGNKVIDIDIYIVFKELNDNTSEFFRRTPFATSRVFNLRTGTGAQEITIQGCQAIEQYQEGTHQVDVVPDTGVYVMLSGKNMGGTEPVVTFAESIALKDIKDIVMSLFRKCFNSLSIGEHNVPLSPKISWVKLPGCGYRLMIKEKNTGTVVFQESLAAAATAFQVPKGLLAADSSYDLEFSACDQTVTRSFQTGSFEQQKDTSGRRTRAPK